MSNILQTVQVKIKSSSSGAFAYGFRLFTGMVLGLTFSLVGETIFGYGGLLFTFVIVTVAGLFLRIFRHWGVVGILIFNLFCILVGMILRMYIHMAPGA